MRDIKFEDCANWIKATFANAKIVDKKKRIELDRFFALAERSGLHQQGVYNNPFSYALSQLTVVDNDGCYSYFRLK